MVGMVRAMMTLKIKLIITFGLIVGFCVVLDMVRRKSLELKYALSWLLVDMLLLLIVLVPGLLNGLTRMLGIYSEINMVFFLGFCFLILIVFVMTVALSRNSERIRKLTQQMALYEKLLDEKKDGARDD
jgi:hypothetical protein